MLGSGAFSYRLPEGTYTDDLHRRSAFFSDKMGLRLLGTHIKGVAPMYRLMPMDNLVGGLKSHSSHTRGQFEEYVASRTFFLFEHNPSRVADTLKKIQSLSLSPRIVCSEADARSLSGHVSMSSILRGNRLLVSNYAVLLVYDTSLSKESLAHIRGAFLTESCEAAKLVSLLAATTKNLKIPAYPSMETDNFFCTAEYYPHSKPFSRTILDAVFYMEKWDLLTEEEQTLRCISSLLLFPIIIPFILLNLELVIPSALSAHPNLMQWQLAEYRKGIRNEALSHLDPSNQSPSRKPLDDIVSSILKERGWVDDEGQLTERAHYVSHFHNFIGLEPLSGVSKDAANSRVAFMLSTLVAALSSVAYLALEIFVHARFAYILSLISCIAVATSCSIVALNVVSNGTKTKNSIMPVGFSVLMFSALFVGLEMTLGNYVTPFSRIFCCSAILFSCLLYAAASVSMSFLYRKDIAMSDELGLSTTSYLEIKPAIVAALEGPIVQSYRQLAIHSYLHALRVGQGNVDLLFAHALSASSRKEPPQQQDTLECPPAADVTHVSLEEAPGAAHTATIQK